MLQQNLSVSGRIKPALKTQGLSNGTSGGPGQQQASALCDISAQVQQYQQFLGEETRSCGPEPGRYRPDEDE